MNRAGQAAGGLGARRWLARLSQEQIVLLVTALVTAVFALTLPGFATLGNLLALLNSIAVLGILSLGAAIVIIGRGLDISQIASMAVGAATAALVLHSGAGLGWALLAGFGIAVAIGVLNGILVAFVEIPALFATLATNLLVYGLARTWLFGGNAVIYLPDDAGGLMHLGDSVAGIPVPVLVFFGLCLLVHLLLSRTSVGRFIYAHGDNPDAARLTGIPVRPLTIVEYCASAVIGYLAGLVLIAMITSINFSMITGTQIFNVILVAVLGGVSLVGGRGGVLSVIAGALLIGVVLNGMTRMNLSSDVQDIVRGLVLLAAIVLDNRLHPRDEETARQGE
ncbi:MAG: ABC transporter permease [Salinisphaera sp.]|nr:ABC transporter permease [Salinisphaera sp.]